MDVLKLLGNQQAQNRANFARTQADRTEVLATKPRQWSAQGRDADSGSMALSADGADGMLMGRRITSGEIKTDQSVRVNGAGGTVTVDQKPSKQREPEQVSVQAEVKPYWVAFGIGFAVSTDTEAKTFTESQYPEYEEYPESVQGEAMFPFGRIGCFAAALDLWVVGGFLDYDRTAAAPQTLRLSFAASSDQGKTWQLCEQFVPFEEGGKPNWVYQLVWGAGYFLAIVGLTQIWRSEDGLQWEQIKTIETPFFSFSLDPALFDAATGFALAVREDVIYLLQSVVGFDATGFNQILKETAIHAYTENLQGTPSFKLVSRIPSNAQSQYGAYNAYGNPVHDYRLNLLQLPMSFYPFLLSGDLDAIPDYGNAVYDPDPGTYSSLIVGGTNQTQAIAYADNIEGQVFLMLSQRWGVREPGDGLPFGFAAMHEGASWRTCEHPFIGKIDSGTNVANVSYSAALQCWLVFNSNGFTSIGGLNGDDWNEPFQPELETTLERDSIASIADQISAFKLSR